MYDSGIRCTCSAVRRAAGSAVPSFKMGLSTCPPYSAVVADKDSRAGTYTRSVGLTQFSAKQIEPACATQSLAAC